MAIGTTGRGSQSRCVASRLAFCLILFAMMPFAAGAAAAVADEPSPPPLTPPCAVPDRDIASPAPLPNVMARLKRRSGTIHILAIGSSSTEGIGASSVSKSYPMRLGPILEKALKGIDVEVVNRGVAGEVAETTADRIMSEVALERPDLVLWQLGTNDALARIPADDFEATVRETVQWLKAQDIDVALVGMQYVPRFSRDPAYSAIRASLQKISAEENVLYVRRYNAMRFMEHMRANEHLMARDDFHLNDLGYRCMAEQIAHAVVFSLFHSKPEAPADGETRSPSD